jgi:hypothetical protein
MAAVEPFPAPVAGDDDDDYEEEESSDEDSVPEEPEFEIELPWYRSVSGRDDSRTLYTRAQCVVKVRVTDTIGVLRQKVAVNTRLKHFKLSIDGAELFAEDPDEGKKKGRKSGAGDVDDEDNDGEDYGDDDDEDDDDNDAEEEEMRQLAIMMAVGAEKERLEAEEVERQRLKYEKANLPQFDNRTLAMIGVKEPPKPKTKEELEADLVKKAMAADAAREDNGGDDVDASFVPREPPAEAEGGGGGAGAVGQITAAPPPDATAGGGGGGTGAEGGGEGGAGGGEGDGGNDPEAAAAAATAVAATEERLSSVVVIDEFDEPLDDRINQKPESSKVLLQRAIDASNILWCVFCL